MLVRMWSFQIVFAVTLLSIAAAEGSKEAAVVVQGIEGPPVRLTESDLQKLPRAEVEAVDHGGTKARYSGVTLRALLDKVGVPEGKKLRGPWLSAYVAVDATDNYRAVFALAELDPTFTDKVVLLADTRDGQALDPKHGPFQIIVPGEKKQARCVRMVKEIRVVNSRGAK